MTCERDENLSFQSLHSERPFAKSAVVDDEEAKASGGDGIPEESR